MKKWKMPKWAEPFRVFLNYNGWKPEEFMNCDGRDCNIVTNGPRAIMCATAQARMIMLIKLHEEGLLKEGT